MKPLVLLLLLAVLVPLRADSLILNGDFSEGMGHWYGDGRSPTDYARDNNLLQPDAFNSKGLIIPLKAHDWCKVAQDFKGKIVGGVVTVTYMLSPNITISDKADDYVNVTHHIHYDGWKPFDVKPGNWLFFISDFGTANGTYWPIPLKPSAQTQTVKMKIPAPKKKNGGSGEDNKTLTLAFPPGTGTVVLLSVTAEPGQ